MCIRDRGKTGFLDHTSSGRYCYQFEETDYNPTYTNYKKYQQFMGSQSNDNDEFMWSANFVDTCLLYTSMWHWFWEITFSMAKASPLSCRG